MIIVIRSNYQLSIHAILLNLYIVCFWIYVSSGMTYTLIVGEIRTGLAELPVQYYKKGSYFVYRAFNKP